MIRAEVLARHSGPCRLCHRPIRRRHDYIVRVERLGCWAHVQCVRSYERALAENDDDDQEVSTGSPGEDGFRPEGDVYLEYMARQPVTTMRLRDSEMSLLEALAADMACSRTDAVRQLIQQEAKSRGLLDAAAGSFLGHLASEYGPTSVLKIVLDAGAVVQATIAGRQDDDFRVELVHDRGGRADVLLEDPASAAALLVTGVVRPRPGLELTIEVPLAFLQEASTE